MHQLMLTLAKLGMSCCWKFRSGPAHEMEKNVVIRRPTPLDTELKLNMCASVVFAKWKGTSPPDSVSNWNTIDAHFHKILPLDLYIFHQYTKEKVLHNAAQYEGGVRGRFHDKVIGLVSLLDLTKTDKKKENWGGERDDSACRCIDFIMYSLG